MTKLDAIPMHDHSRLAEGGPIEDAAVILASGRPSGQTIADPLTLAGDNKAFGLTLYDGLALEANPNTAAEVSAVTWTRNGYLNVIQCATITSGRTWSNPDASGTRVVSQAIVTRSAKNANDSGTILSAPEVGLYLVAWYLEITTAALVGAISLDITSVGAGGSVTQSELSGLSLTSKTARSGIAVVYVASGDVTFATTLTAGAPVYDLRFVPIGRVA